MTGYIGIGGTAKKIKNIYIGVGGVAKQVKKAYIGVGGVAKQWYSATDLRMQLPALMSAATTDNRLAYPIIGCNESELTYVGQLFSSTGTYYIFSFCNGYCSFNKVSYTGRSITISRLNGNSDSYGNVGKDSRGSNYADLVHYAHSIGYVSDSGSPVYGATLVALAFNGYTEAEIDTILQNATLTRLAGRNNSSPTTLYVGEGNISYPCYLFATIEENIAYTKFDSGSSQTTLFSPRSNIHSSLLRYTNNRIYLTTNGTSNASVYGASIIGAR